MTDDVILRGHVHRWMGNFSHMTNGALYGEVVKMPGEFVAGGYGAARAVPRRVDGIGLQI
ncbi:hypothetical protein EGT09_15445 [Pseudomonas putida]|nr:hypothetical protein EGT09_15445 [Pseudomonas putida]